MGSVTRERSIASVDRQQPFDFRDQPGRIANGAFLEDPMFQSIEDQKHERQVFVRIGATAGHPLQEPASLAGIELRI